MWLGFDPWTGAPVLGLRVRGRAARLSVGANDAWWELWIFFFLKSMFIVLHMQVTGKLHTQPSLMARVAYR